MQSPLMNQITYCGFNIFDIKLVKTIFGQAVHLLNCI